MIDKTNVTIQVNLIGGFYRKLAAYGHVRRMDIGLPWEGYNPEGDCSTFF